ncbi:MAG: Type I restriction-modification system, restriction subunit R (EC [uncultured Sulfurovum sp.]|uniref:Type I restriction-modification system, restriction subunit R (EC) n=1 Tax=uncultured Sulfurovum sp. TaxID=269237 RepID=A0A6S6TUU7_9BACT|nr:MAG: Type I restriction-modification system, restriction subunit R (EC [uncultured Sulfurovum sp.]
MTLLGKYNDAKEEDKKAQKEQILNIINGDARLRSKRELIEKFINKNLPHIEKNENIADEFENFWEEEREKGFKTLCSEEKLKCDEVQKVVDSYLYDERKPLSATIVQTLESKPKLLERRKVIPHVTTKILDYVEKFMDGVGVANRDDYNEVLMVAEPKEKYRIEAKPKAPLF